MTTPMRAAAAALLALLLCPGHTAAVRADEHVVKPRGEYARIDVVLANETIAALTSGTEAEKGRAIQAVEAAPQKYAPPVLYVLSSTLFAQGRKDDAAFWFYAGQLRGRFDANRCADVSARQAIAVLNDRFGPDINKYTFKDIPKLQALIPRVVEWDRKTPHEYDHRWINLHGMTAMIDGLDGPSGKPKALSLPRAQWEALAEKTRTDYLEGFKQAYEMVQKERAATPGPTAAAKPGWERGLVGGWKQEMESLLRFFPKQLPGVTTEAERMAAAERQRVQWAVTADTIAVWSPIIPAERRAPPYRYRIAKVEGNVATLEMTPPDGQATEWTVEYLEPDIIRLMMGTEEVYRLRRLPAAAGTRR
jgi:hypothetical protein